MFAQPAEFPGPPLAKWLNDLHSERRRPLQQLAGSNLWDQTRDRPRVSRPLFKSVGLAFAGSGLGLGLHGLSGF